MKRLLFRILVSGFFCCYFFCGCTLSARQPQITVVMKTHPSKVEFWEVAMDGVKTAADEFGVKLEITGIDEEFMVDEQIALVDEIIKDKPDVMVLIATDFERLAPSVERAAAQDIKIVTLDSDVNSAKRICFIASDNLEIGRQMGVQLSSLLESGGKVAVIGHIEGTSTGIDRVEGALGVLRTRDDIELVGVYYCDNRAARAKEIVLGLLKEQPDIAGFIGTNEISNLGVAHALSEAGKAGSIKLVGCDNSRQQIQFLEQGVIQAIVVQQPFSMGYTAIKQAVKVAHGEAVDSFTDIECVVITRENMYTEKNQKLLFPFQSAK